MWDQTADADRRKILIAGDCILRKGIAHIVRCVAPSASIVEAWCFSDATARLKSDEFFAAIFGIDTTDWDGPVDLRSLRAEHPRLVLGVVSRTGTADIILDYLTMGVNGYILSSSSQSESERAIATLLGRAIYIPPIATAPTTRVQGRDLAPPAQRRRTKGLTVRQRAVLTLLMNKCSNKEIARELDLSPHTVKIHVSALLRYFSVQRRLDVTLVASTDEEIRCCNPVVSRSALEIDVQRTGEAALHMY
jgi:DNA-binding NarL/FixJ family response regulator